MFLKNALTYSGVNLISQAAGFVSGFFLRRFLPPELMGVWNMASVVRGYIQAISLGALSGAARELPILRGQGETAEEDRCRSVALTFSLVEVLLLGLCVWGYAFWKREALTPLEFYALLVVGVMMIPARLQEAYVPFFQGVQRYVPLSRVLLIGGLFSAVALPVGAMVAGVPGLLLAALLVEWFRGIWILSVGQQQDIPVSIRWDGRIWRRLVSYGIPYRLADYPNTFFMMFDLLWVTKFAGLGGLGLYALAKSFYTQASDITVRMGTVLYTRALTQYGRGVDQEKIASDMRRFMLFQLLVSVPVVCWGVASIAPILVRQIIPLYSESVPLLLILLLGSFFISQNNNLFTLWIAEKRLGRYGVSNLVGVLTVGCSMAFTWFVLWQRSLTDVAMATVLGYAGYFAYMVFSAGRELWGMRTAFGVFVQVVLSAAWTFGVLVIGGQEGIQAVDWREDLSLSLLASLKMFIGMLPLIAFGLWVSGGGTYLYRTAAASLRMKCSRA